MKGFEAAAQAELPVLYRVARRLTLDASAAEDLVGQTLLQAAKGWSDFDGRFPKSWMIRILQNIHIKEMGKLRSQATHVPFEETNEPIDESGPNLDDRLTTMTILDSLDRLPEEYRLAVTLCDMEELSYEEAADAMGVPVGTVRSRLFRGRKMLRERLEPMINPGTACGVRD